MGKDSGIEWCDHTWNPWRGCTKKGIDCLHCYMFREQKRFGGDPTRVIRCADATFNAPLRWAKDAVTPPSPLVFACSWSDFFHVDADPWREDAWDIIKKTAQLQYLILTKRAELIPERLPIGWGENAFAHVALGTSIGNQDTCGRIGDLQNVSAPWFFLSAEPLIGHIDLRPYWVTGRPRCPDRAWDWLVIGGESDMDDPREMNLDDARRLIDFSRGVGVPVFVKQLGTVWARRVGAESWKGSNPEEWPEDLRIREFPWMVLDMPAAAMSNPPRAETPTLVIAYP